MMNAKEQYQVLKNAKKFATSSIDRESYCSQCKHTGWITSRNDYRAKRGKTHEYPCPNCNKGASR